MRRRQQVGLVLALALAACSRPVGNSIVVVTVRAAPGMPDVKQLRATLTNGSASDVQLFPPTVAAAAIKFDASFVLSLPTARSGNLRVDIDAMDTPPHVVASGGHDVTIDVGGRADVLVQLQLTPTSDAAVLDTGGGEVGRALDLGPRDEPAGAEVPAGTGGAGGNDSAVPDLAADAPASEATGAGGAGGAGGTTVVGGAGGASATGGVSGSGGVLDAGSDASGGSGGQSVDGPSASGPEPAAEAGAEPGPEPGAEPGSEPGPEPGPEPSDAALPDAPQNPDAGSPTWVDRTPSPLPSTWPTVRSELAMAYDPARNLSVMFGGWLGGTNYRLAETWEWNGAAGTWQNRTPATLPSSWPLAMVGPALAYDGHGHTFLFGGYASGVAWLNGAWEWNGSTAAGTWQNRTPATLPSAWPAARAWCTMVYDSARDVVVLFGGSISGGAANDVWEWSGVSRTWVNRPSSGQPGGWPAVRSSYGMAYDSTRGKVVMFGGGTDAGLFNDTWEWDGAAGTWSNRTPAPLPAAWPTARAQLAMAYDSVRGKVVMFGGNQGRSGGVLVDLQDTWEWDGAAGSWTDLTPSSLPAAWPEARSAHAMVYDAIYGGVMLFGGGDYVTIRFPSSNTWEWLVR